MIQNQNAIQVIEPRDTIIVIPAFNEEQSLPGVLAELSNRLPDIDIVVVDDGSADATSVVACVAGAVVVELPFNMGIGGALRAGFRYAHEHGYKVAVQFDADGQHHADQVPLLLAAIDEGTHLVIGNRFGTDGYPMGRLRRIAVLGLRLGVRMLCGRRFADTSSGFRAVSQPLLEAFASEYPVEYMDSVETLVAACRAGYQVTEVPVTMGPRTGGTASTGPVRLAYHYARLAVALAGGTRRALPAPRL